ncbi:sulfate reduction electron transfer complex DsrMKJOP subunit DsrO [Campylobacter geochelonis]|uniref:sulfate reduction electron transfer complex DsrMKJOP subunit DsrO n=1 Tax=Campylobacter geochelonis TaxID=1780362 RepID=UPI0007708224|nr:4Fe-4S dicluster domain-containing protein [Campylobacter geochelonis]CZE48300.1 methyl-accepting chemotaxis sensory transducer [Campylobacter geochelonis]
MKFSKSRREFALSALFFGINANAFTLKNPGRDEKIYKYVGDKTKHFVMVVDLRKCVGCQGCTSACIVENNVPEDNYRTFVNEYEIGSYPDVRKSFLPSLCNHCKNPSCVSVCPTGATFKRDDGIVVVDNTICWGCGYCINACPYDKRFYNKKTKVADKCTFCAHRTDNGLLPACVETCVGGARVFGNLKDKNSEVYRLLSTYPTTVLNKSAGTKPQVFYIGLDSRISDYISNLALQDDFIKRKESGITKEWSVKFKEDL